MRSKERAHVGEQAADVEEEVRSSDWNDSGGSERDKFRPAEDRSGLAAVCDEEGVLVESLGTFGRHRPLEDVSRVRGTASRVSEGCWEGKQESLSLVEIPGDFDELVEIKTNEHENDGVRPVFSASKGGKEGQ